MQSCRSRTQPVSGVGDASQDRVGVIQVIFIAYLKEFDYEQPENVQARRRVRTCATWNGRLRLGDELGSGGHDEKVAGASQIR
jgi:hypothetical protein